MYCGDIRDLIYDEIDVVWYSSPIYFDDDYVNNNSINTNKYYNPVLGPLDFPN